MSKIEGTIVADGRLESGEQATCGIVLWTTAEQKAEMERWECNGLVVVERKADHDASVLVIEQLCEEIGKLRTDLAVREDEVERLRDVERRRVAEGMSAWCSPPAAQAAKAGKEPAK